MHKLTKLTVDELRTQYQKEYEEEKARAMSKFSRFNALHGSDAIFVILNCGYDYIEKILKAIFDTERKALSHERVPLAENYFEELKGETRAIISNIYEEILNKSGKIFTKESLFTNELQKHKVETEISIGRRVEKLQEEIRLGIEPISRTTINISGDVGTLNTGVVYGNVHGQVQKITDSKVASAFNTLLEEINNSNIDDDIKAQQMQNVGFLIEQYQLPKKERNIGVINVVINALSTIASLASVWAQHGPVIIEALK
jgi:hypothetical protein